MGLRRQGENRDAAHSCRRGGGVTEGGAHAPPRSPTNRVFWGRRNALLQPMVLHSVQPDFLGQDQCHTFFFPRSQKKGQNRRSPIFNPPKKLAGGESGQHYTLQEGPPLVSMGEVVIPTIEPGQHDVPPFGAPLTHMATPETPEKISGMGGGGGRMQSQRGGGCCFRLGAGEVRPNPPYTTLSKQEGI